MLTTPVWRSFAELEHSGCLSRHLPRELALLKVFDRTSLILSLRLPRSGGAGRAPSLFSTSAVHRLDNCSATTFPLPRRRRRPATRHDVRN